MLAQLPSRNRGRLRAADPLNRKPRVCRQGLPEMCPHFDKPRLWEERLFNPDLSIDCVDVWKVNLDEPLSSPPPLTILSSDELTRSSRFRFGEDRLHFVRCRSALRLLLGDYLRIPAAELRFEYQPGGKPEVADQQNPGQLQFNVSHSGSLALIAVSAGHRVGVDIERVRGDVDTMSLAEQFFSPRERDGLLSLPDDLRLAAFFSTWTRKESFLKAIGDGLSFPLADFSITTHPELDPVIEEVRGDTNVGKQWSLVTLGRIDGYCAAVAVEGMFSRLETYVMSDAGWYVHSR